MTAPSQFAEIVASDKALTQSEDGKLMLFAYPSMQHRRALIALVREARGLLDELEISRSQCGVYNGTTWADRRSAFMTRTEEP